MTPRRGPGRREEDATLRQVLDELKKIELKVNPLSTMAKDLTELKQIAEIWRDAKTLGRGALYVGRGVRYLAGFAAAVVALWVLFKQGFAALVASVLPQIGPHP